MVAAPTHTATILVVDDSRNVRELLSRLLLESGYEVHTADDGETGLARALEIAPDLLILDIGLPGRSGFEVAEELRRRSFRAPLLMLTARTEVADRVTGLEAGADDYLPKPFDNDELVARVRALLRRSSLRTEMRRLRVGDLSLDPISRTARRGDREILLSQKEYALLEFMMRNAGRTLTRQILSENVWQQPFDPNSNIVDVYVNYLRRKIEQDDEATMLITLRRVGYVLRNPRGDG